MHQPLSVTRIEYNYEGASQNCTRSHHRPMTQAASDTAATHYVTLSAIRMPDVHTASLVGADLVDLELGVSVTGEVGYPRLLDGRKGHSTKQRDVLRIT